ncbi:MAG: TrmH family RNA methyltransferase [Candidatus Saccharicenans sp.]|nr:TrmH family RNA methyltransferase [Candidatus Saccharicenans sp.]MDI6849402.1 TrmH family RNA methyltransferase [Candidatus Saccharicenans sp.]
MKLPYLLPEDRLQRDRFSVILVNPENQENIGLVARAMKNTGFSHLRIVGLEETGPDALRTAVHSAEILKKASFFPTLKEAVSDLNLVLASTVRQRKAFRILTVDEMLEKIKSFPALTRVGLVFGNERTGLSDRELRRANFVYFIPQAGRQPSYNLAAAVLLSLYAIFRESGSSPVPQTAPPIPRKEQEDCIKLILKKLEKRGFMHDTNREHVTDLLYDLFGRLTLSERDRRFLTAVFNKGLGGED